VLIRGLPPVPDLVLTGAWWLLPALFYPMKRLPDPGEVDRVEVVGVS
jgi:hypothetical protein